MAINNLKAGSGEETPRRASLITEKSDVSWLILVFETASGLTKQLNFCHVLKENKGEKNT
jgi:hypothetical protein